MNFDKMKVVDLRTELQARGLDTKGEVFGSDPVPMSSILTIFFNSHLQASKQRSLTV